MELSLRRITRLLWDYDVNVERFESGKYKYGKKNTSVQELLKSRNVLAQCPPCKMIVLLAQEEICREARCNIETNYYPCASPHSMGFRSTMLRIESDNF